MSKKKPPTTIEECNAEMELTQKKIRQYENRNKMLDRKLAIEKRKERNHRLCSRGGYLESLVPALIDMSEQEARDFLYTAVFSDKAQEFLRKRAGEATPKNYPCTQGRIIRDIQLSEENLKKCRYERLSEIFPRIM